MHSPVASAFLLIQGTLEMKWQDFNGGPKKPIDPFGLSLKAVASTLSAFSVMTFIKLANFKISLTNKWRKCFIIFDLHEANKLINV